MRIISPSELDELFKDEMYRVQVTIGDRTLSTSFTTADIEDQYGSYEAWVEGLQSQSPGETITLQYAVSNGSNWKGPRRMCQIDDGRVKQEETPQMPQIIYDQNDMISMNGIIKPGASPEEMKYANVLIADGYNKKKASLEKAEAELKELTTKKKELEEKIDQMEREHRKREWEIDFERRKFEQETALAHKMEMAQITKPSGIQELKSLLTDEGFQGMTTNAVEKIAESFAAKGMNAPELSQEEQAALDWFRSQAQHKRLVYGIMNQLAHKTGFSAKLSEFLSTTMAPEEYQKIKTA